MALCDTIKEHNTDDSKIVDALLKDLKQLCTFKPTHEKIVGLLGRSGEGEILSKMPIFAFLHGSGKSSLINSLLGFTDLAPAVSESGQQSVCNARLMYTVRET